MPDYSNRPGGALFAKDPARKTNPNQPDFDGELILDPAVMATLLEQWKNGQPIKLELAGWKKTSQKGNNFLSLSAKLPRDRTRPVASPRRDAFFMEPEPDDEVPF